MTNEEKELLLKDLCAHMPYGIIVKVTTLDGETFDRRLSDIHIDRLGSSFRVVNPNILPYGIDEVKPYLRNRENMTNKEANEVTQLFHVTINSRAFLWIEECQDYIDWLNAHHFDYRGLIEKGLAIEAPENMYNQ